MSFNVTLKDNFITYIGKGNISVSIVADSYSSTSNKRITTLILEYPRFIHAEFLTHRVFSKNSSSSRAIPVTVVIESLLKDPAQPVWWGKKQSGMQAKEEVDDNTKALLKDIWSESMNSAVMYSRQMDAFGCHKQLANRLLEPYSMIKVLVTSTEWNNFDWLRNHEDAQPEIRELAHLIKSIRDNNKPNVLLDGEWHLPFIRCERIDDKQRYFSNNEELDLDTALMISTSCSAQTSYRKLDTSIDKAKKIYSNLIESVPMHASPTEHAAMAYGFIKSNSPFNWPKGVTHMYRDGSYWSGNFNGWIQYRQLLDKNSMRG